MIQDHNQTKKNKIIQDDHHIEDTKEYIILHLM